MQEIAKSKTQLENICGEEIRLFAYPNGTPGKDYCQRHVDMVRELGFDAAVSTVRGNALPYSDPWQLPRFTPWDRTPRRFMARSLLNTFDIKAFH